jgi:hypothetical protein
MSGLIFEQKKPSFIGWKVGFVHNITLLKHRVKSSVEYLCHHRLIISCKFLIFFSSLFLLMYIVCIVCENNKGLRSFKKKD